MPHRELCVVLATVPDAEVGRRLARTLLDEGLIACANLVPAVVSLYRWEGEVQEEGETLLLLKSRMELVPRLLERIPELHPYELPEVLALSVAGGLPAYCRWVLDETEPRR
jgi:periplasmic divalent cation tolerance protein